MESFTLPALKILKAQGVPNNNLASLIKNTKGNFTEIGNDFEFDDKRLIKEIYQNSPNLRYFKLYSIKNDDVSKLENLINYCQRLLLIFPLSVVNFHCLL